MLMLAVSTLMSCNSNTSTDSTNEKGELTDVVVDIKIENPDDTTNQYGNIVQVFEIGDTTYLKVDYVQYLTGDAAIEAARNANEVDTFKTKDGKLEFAVPNDYFILNESKRTRKIALAKNCTFDLLYKPDRVTPITDNSLKSLIEIYSDNVFLLTINKNGYVIKIKEMFQP